MGYNLDVIGKNIKTIRKSLKITQKELSDRTRINQGLISRIERGQVPEPGIYKIAAIAKALKVTIEQLLGLTTNSRIEPLPIIGKTIGSPDGAYFTDQDFPVGAGEDLYHINDPNAFILIVESDSMSPTVRAGDRVIVTPNKDCHSGDICVVRLVKSGRTFLKRIAIRSDTIILSSDNPAYAPFDHKRQDIDWLYRVEAIIPK